jgi:hypothetical protein
MTDLGRLRPFVAVTQSIAIAMPAKGNLRPETALHWDLAQGPFADPEAAVRITLLKPPVLTHSGLAGSWMVPSRSTINGSP